MVLVKLVALHVLLKIKIILSKTYFIFTGLLYDIFSQNKISQKQSILGNQVMHKSSI